MRSRTRNIGLVIFTIVMIAFALVNISGSETKETEKPSTFGTREVDRRVRALSVIGGDVRITYCMPRVADLEKKKELKTQLELPTEEEDLKITALKSNCTMEFIETFQ